MSGQIVRRGSSWQLRVYAGDGKVVTRTFKGSERDAHRALARLVVEVDEGRSVPTKGRTVATLARAWLEAKSPGWSPKVAHEYRRWVDNELLPAVGAVPLSRFRAEDIDRFYGALRRRGNSPATIARKHNILTSMLGQAVRWGWIGVNPASRATKPSVPPAKIVPPDPAKVARLLAYLAETDRPMFVFVLLAADTGARRGQLMALRWDDLDLEGRTVSFTKTQGIGGEIRPLSKTKGRARTVPLGADTVRRLSVHRVAMRERALFYGAHLRPKAFVFSDDPACATSWPIPTFHNRYMRMRRAAGAGEVNFHQLRHYVATQLIAAGVDVRTVADRLGHARTSTTLDMYAAPVSELGRTAADLLERILGEAKRNFSS